MIARIVFFFFFLGSLNLPVWGAVWQGSGEIGLITFYAEMDDTKDCIQLMLRIENNSKLKSIKVSRFFVQMTDGENNRLRPITADELVAEKLKRMRRLLPQHALEINQLLVEIKADFPQEKVVEVYGRLKKYMQRGRPISWRTWIENFLLRKKASKNSEVLEAKKLLQEIGYLAKNYFWPQDIAPDNIYTGIVFFEKPNKFPPSVFFQIGEKFIGAKMRIVKGDKDLNNK